MIARMLIYADQYTGPPVSSRAMQMECKFGNSPGVWFQQFQAKFVPGVETDPIDQPEAVTG
ncbi:hypothetical protein ABIF91_001578 [Bradyrhizobium sp. USDA 241]